MSFSRKIYISNGIFCLILSICLLSCKSPDDSSKENSFKVVATTGMIADGLSQLFNEEVEISSLMGPGIDPHLYKPSFSDLSKLKEADLIIYNGFHLEGKMTEILENLARTKTVIPLSEFAPKNQLLETEGFQGFHDPHLWFDTRLWNESLQGLSDELNSRDEIRPMLNTQISYFNSLDTLDNWVEMKVNKIPKKNRVLITAHDAFGYFGNRYGIEVVGLQGISTLSEAGIKDIENLVDLIITRKIPAVFIESSVSPKSIEAVLKGCQARGFEVKLGGSLFSDAMGEAGTPEGTYLGMVKHNTITIFEALNKTHD